MWRGYVLAGTILALSACGVPDNGQAGAGGGRIAYVVTRDAGNADLALMDADGGRRQWLTDTPQPELYPAWSPDGARLVFSSSEEPVVRGRLRRLQLFSMPATGGERASVTERESQRTYDLAPSWSPDGADIAFISASAAVGSTDLWLVDASGAAEPRAVLPAPRPNVRGDIRSMLGGVADPSFSPDGTRVAISGTSGPGIFIVNLDGSGIRRLTAGGIDLEPAWSPDGTRIAFTRLKWGNFDQAEPPQTDLYVVNVDGTQLRQLTVGAANERSPGWSPDGTRLVYASTGPSEPVPPGGLPVPSPTPFPPTHTLPPVTATPSSLPTPAPPDSGEDPLAAYPALQRTPQPQQAAGPTATPAYPPPDQPDDSAGYPFALPLTTPANDIFVINADGTGMARLTDTPESESDPAWQPGPGAP